MQIHGWWVHFSLPCAHTRDIIDIHRAVLGKIVLPNLVENQLLLLKLVLLWLCVSSQDS